MTGPRLLSFEEWDAQEPDALTFEEWDAQQSRRLPTLRSPRGAMAPSDQTRTTATPDTESWKSAFHHPGAVEQVATGLLGMPMEVAAHPVDAIAGLIKSLADPAKVGQWIDEKVRGSRIPLKATELGMRAHGTPYRGPVEPVREPVSNAEALGAALNTLAMGAGALKAGAKPKVVPEPVRVPRPGVVRIPAERVPQRLAQMEINRLGEPVPTSGEVPLNVPFPPAERTYPLGATTGDLLDRAGRVRKPFEEPLPTPYATKGVGRRAVAEQPVLSFEEWDARQKAMPPSEPPPDVPPVESIPAEPIPAEPIPTIGEPVSVGREPLFKRKGKEPDFNTGDILPDETASVGKLPEPVVRRGPTFDKAAPETPPVQIESAPVAPAAPVVEAPAAAPNPVHQPREFINYARMKLSQTGEARLRDTVEGMRAEGTLAKQPMTVAEIEAEGEIFKRQFLQDPLSLDKERLANMSGIEAQGVKTLIRENTTMLEGVAKSLRSGELTPAEASEASALFDRLTEETQSLLPVYVKAAERWGQSGVAFRQAAKLSLDPDVWLVKAQKVLGSDKVLPDEVMVRIRRLAREAAEQCAGGMT